MHTNFISKSKPVDQGHHFRNGDRVEVAECAPGNITGWGRIECACNGRPGMYYVRFPAGEVELFDSRYLARERGPEKGFWAGTVREG